ncbi:hypothetical protein GCM10027020_28920 [Nocardioides salsibiostraticola]
MHRWDPIISHPPALTRPVRLDNSGVAGPTRSSARRSRWRQTSHGFYVPSHVDPHLPEQRILEQSMRLRSGAVTGWSSLRMHGAQFFDGVAGNGTTRLPVPLSLANDGLRPNPATTHTRHRLEAHEVVTLWGVRCTSPDRALLDELRSIDDLVEQVIAIDMTLAAELTTIERFGHFLRRSRGGDQYLVALGMAVEDSRSPMETRFRLVWERSAGWPRPLCNQAVFGLSGRLLGTPDLLDPHLGIIGEYDGAEHRSRQRHTQDIRRESDFRGAGLEYVAVVGADVYQPDRIVARMEAARSRARRYQPQWTLEPPHWFVSPRPLAERVAQRELRRLRVAS